MAFGPQDVIDIVRRHPPAFAPGEKVVYCDTNYVLLGLIIELVTGRPVSEVIGTEIVAPLGLDGTSFPNTPAMPVPFARGYYAGADGKGELRDYTASNPAVA
jgi:D-alanyl-D-alanine carboxypeptidase